MVPVSPLSNRLLVCTLVVVFMAFVAIGCSQGISPGNGNSGSNATGQASGTGIALSGMARDGEALFNANCSVCHGVNAAGTMLGPPLMDRVYHPGHHADFTIRNAVRQGVPQHHWGFGNMPPVAGVSPDDVEKIICYVREMQRAEGIFEGDAFPTVC